MTESNRDKARNLLVNLPARTQIEDLAQALSTPDKKISSTMIDRWRNNPIYSVTIQGLEMRRLPLSNLGVLIIAYIFLLRKQDVSHEDIRSELREANWLEDNIDELLKLELAKKLTGSKQE